MRIRRFVQSNARCLERDLRQGHLTASAWVLDPSQSRILLMHHQKLGKWLQPGGHADGEGDMIGVARREVREETGLDSLVLLEDGIFDLDIHLIPPSQKESSHFHYDFRFLFRSESEELTKNSESKELRWVAFSEVGQLTQEPSILRMNDSASRLNC